MGIVVPGEDRDLPGEDMELPGKVGVIQCVDVSITEQVSGVNRPRATCFGGLIRPLRISLPRPVSGDCDFRARRYNAAHVFHVDESAAGGV